MSFNTPIHTNEQSADRVLNVGLPVFLVFWRKDCEPCARLNPSLDRLAGTYAGKALIAKVDGADNPGLAQRYTVTQLPSLIFVQRGTVAARAIGAVAEADLRAWLDALLKGSMPPQVQVPSGPSVPIRPISQSAAQQPDRQPHPGPQPSSTPTLPLVLTDTTFDQLIKQRQPVMVGFWAPWCGPCRMIAPTIDRLAHEFVGRAVVAKLNIDDHPRIAQRFGIQSIPAVFIFRSGQDVDRVMGAQPAPVLRQALERQLI